MKFGFRKIALVACFALAGCGATINCDQICQRYADCWDTNYDVSSCESRCTDHSSNDDADQKYRQTAAECDTCISDSSCSAATFNCGAQCSSVVP